MSLLLLLLLFTHCLSIPFVARRFILIANNQSTSPSFGNSWVVGGVRSRAECGSHCRQGQCNGFTWKEDDNGAVVECRMQQYMMEEEMM